MRLIVLGDSLSAGNSNWPELLSKDLNCELINFAKPAIQNLLQIQILQDWLLENKLFFDDIIIWQIGWSLHETVHVGIEHINKIERFERIIKNKIGISQYHIRNNLIDDEQRISLLPVSPLQHKFFDRKRKSDEAEILQNLLFMFFIIKKMCPKILIVRGTDDFVKYEYWTNMEKFFKEKNIDYLNESIYNWCIKENLEIGIDNHPTTESLRVYIDKVLYPKIKSLGWLL